MNATQRLAHFALELNYKQYSRRSDRAGQGLYSRYPGGLACTARRSRGAAPSADSFATPRLRGRSTVIGRKFLRRSRRKRRSPTASWPTPSSSTTCASRARASIRARPLFFPAFAMAEETKADGKALLTAFVAALRSDVAHRRCRRKLARAKRFSRARIDRYFRRCRGGRPALGIE